MIFDANHIKNLAAGLGADLCGIAPIDRFNHAPEGFHPQDVFSECRAVIVLASRFALGTLQAEAYVPYTFVRNRMVEKMDSIAFELANELDLNGVTAAPIPSAEPYAYWDAERRHGRGILSLKHAGELAGIGRIGKNTLLVNERFGNMMWLSAVLVSEELETDPLAAYEGCIPGCKLCLEACPQKALNGVTIDQKLCRSRSVTNTEGGGWYLSCNLCRKICPNYKGIRV